MPRKEMLYANGANIKVESSMRSTQAVKLSSSNVEKDLQHKETFITKSSQGKDNPYAQSSLAETVAERTNGNK
jgi:hypothetical protein